MSELRTIIIIIIITNVTSGLALRRDRCRGTVTALYSAAAVRYSASARLSQQRQRDVIATL